MTGDGKSRNDGERDELFMRGKLDGEAGLFDVNECSDCKECILGRNLKSGVES